MVCGTMWLKFMLPNDQIRKATSFLHSVECRTPIVMLPNDQMINAAIFYTKMPFKNLTALVLNMCSSVIKMLIFLFEKLVFAQSEFARHFPLIFVLLIHK
jgi:hypothetical protein